MNTGSETTSWSGPDLSFLSAYIQFFYRPCKEKIGQSRRVSDTDNSLRYWKPQN